MFSKVELDWRGRGVYVHTCTHADDKGLEWKSKREGKWQTWSFLILLSSLVEGRKDTAQCFEMGKNIANLVKWMWNSVWEDSFSTFEWLQLFAGQYSLSPSPQPVLSRGYFKPKIWIRGFKIPLEHFLSFSIGNVAHKQFH